MNTGISGGEARPVGVVTNRDIVLHAIACDLNPEEIALANLLPLESATVGVGADLAISSAQRSKL